MEIVFFDITRGSDIAALISVAVILLMGIFAGCLVKVDNKKKVPEQSGLGGVEALLLGIAGAIIARVFIWLLLLPQSNPNDGAIVVGHLFFLIPSIIDDFIALAGQRVLTTPEGILFLATVIGAFVAMMDGVWRIHNWKGLGWLSFPLDLTWGLAGNNYGLLLHVINFAWGNHGTETRTNAHRYKSGFRLKSKFAFTQGSVMSSLSDAPGTQLYKHEKTHVWQNRIFGPFYTINYIGWMLFWLIPGLIAGAVSKDARGNSVGAGKGAERWCYFNCPWELWGYAVQNQKRSAWGPELIWPAAPIIIAAVLIFGTITTFLIILYAYQIS